MKNRSRAGQKLKEARQKEKEADLKTAEKLYQAVIKLNSGEYLAYDRLMIIYRRQQEIKKELDIIDTAIQNLKTHHLERQNAWIEKNETAAGLSRDLAISLGLMDHEGLPLSPDPLLDKWQKRKALLEKRKQNRKTGTKTNASKTPKPTPQKKKLAPTAKTKSAKKRNINSPP